MQNYNHLELVFLWGKKNKQTKNKKQTTNPGHQFPHECLEMSLSSGSVIK